MSSQSVEEKIVDIKTRSSLPSIPFPVSRPNDAIFIAQETEVGFDRPKKCWVFRSEELGRSVRLSEVFSLSDKDMFLLYCETEVAIGSITEALEAGDLSDQAQRIRAMKKRWASVAFWRASFMGLRQRLGFNSATPF
jgi:hypothetical protein